MFLWKSQRVSKPQRECLRPVRGSKRRPVFQIHEASAHEAHEQILMIVHVTLAGERTRS